jgi:hypothetical protein
LPFGFTFSHEADIAASLALPAAKDRAPAHHLHFDFLMPIFARNDSGQVAKR